MKALKFPSDNMPILQYISFTNSNTRSSGLNKLKHNYCRTSLSRHFYFNHIVRLWNKLPSIDLSNSILSIKHHLVTHLWNHFHTHFDPSNTCTLHFLVPVVYVSCNNCIFTFHQASPLVGDCPSTTFHLCITLHVCPPVSVLCCKAL